MPKDWVIGIGGTGARVVEALVHCCTAGLGPDELGVFLIDADSGNGNLARTTSLLGQYQEARARISQHEALPLCRCKITTPEQTVWGILDKGNEKLENAIGLANLRMSRPELHDLVSLLFTRRELETELNEGFRGHPAIGAVVMSSPPLDRDPWKRFWADVQECDPNGARVFLVGSVFGGTGAAGVPTFGAGDLLKFHPNATIENDKSSRIWLGSALVLPYFSFEGAPLANEGEPMFVTPADFPLATKAALEFYATKKLAFDEMYLIGDSIGQRVGRFSPGNRSQVNRPHYVELATALAALDFFHHHPAKDAAAFATRYFATARAGDDVDWAALPVTRIADRVTEQQTALKLRLGALATFACALGTLGVQALTLSHHEMQLHTWYRRWFPDRDEQSPRNPRAQLNRQAIDAFRALSGRFLAWTAGLADDGVVSLIDAAKAIDPAGKPWPHETYAANLGHLIKSVPSSGNTFAEFIESDLNAQVPPRAPMAGGDAFLHLFCASAEQFCRRNYRLDAVAASGKVHG